VPSIIKAAQYIRMSTDHQPLSLGTQMEAIEAYAKLNNIDVIQTYQDEGKSGLSIRKRLGMQQLLKDVMESDCPFKKVLVLDISRWGRFQDTDESAYYEYHCRKNGVEVIYVAEPFPVHPSPLDAVTKQLKRVMAAEYSRELGVKVRAGQERVVRLGFVAGLPPCLGFRREVVDANGRPKKFLEDGERKPMPTDRVRWVLGPPHEIALVRRIFDQYVNTDITQSELTNQLNAEGLKTRRGVLFTHRQIRGLIACEVVCGTYVWGKSRKASRIAGPAGHSEPLRITCAFEAIVDSVVWEQAKKKRRERRRYTPEQMVTLLREYPEVSSRSLGAFGLPAVGALKDRFGTFAAAKLAAGGEWGPGVGAWYERRVGGIRVLRNFFHDLLGLLHRHGVDCQAVNKRRSFEINGILVKVKIASPIATRRGVAWQASGLGNWANGWMLVMRLNEDRTGKDFYLLPPVLAGKFKGWFSGESLKTLDEWRLKDSESLVRRLRMLAAESS
jgi:DNA invertase Pin-like site-specific DNA recombinase